MPTEPERNIEKQLKAYRDERRREAGEPFTLHPVNRAQLQQEVAAQHAAGPTSERSGFYWLAFWMRLAWLSSACAVALLAFIFLQTKQSPWQMAQQDKFHGGAFESASPAEIPAEGYFKIVPPPVAQPEPVAEREEQLRSHPAPMALPPPPTVTTGLTLAGKTTLPDVSRDEVAIDMAGAAAPRRVLGELAASAPAAPPVPARAESKLSERQRFVQTNNREKYRANFNSPPVAPVLKQFELERADDTIRIIDADGSIYQGTITPLAAPVLSKELPAAVAQARGGAALEGAGRPSNEEADAENRQATGTHYRLSVTGLNQTLNQPVRVEAQLFLPAAPGRKAGDSSGALAPQRLQGRVLIGSSQQQEIEAVAVQP